MLHRFYDIKAENEQFEEFVHNQEYILDVPEYDMSTPLERQEGVGYMLDILTAASGVNVCSFKVDQKIA